MNVPNYRLRLSDTNTLLYVIEDIGPWEFRPTVTNRAEEVHADLSRVMDGRKLVCVDSEGMLDIIELDRNGRAVFSRCDPEWLGPLGPRLDVYARTWRHISQHRARGSLLAEKDRDKMHEQWAKLRPREQKMVVDLGCAPDCN
jgi:hypothetical protein